MKTLAIVSVLLVGVAGCKGKSSTTTGGSAAGSSAGSSMAGSAMAPVAPPDAASAGSASVDAPAAAAAAAPDLPLASDVLPSDEATPKSRAFVADDFLYQVPETFTKTTQDGQTAYTGTVDGFGAPATLTFWATSEPFKGNLDALVTREKKAIADAKGEEPDVGPVMAFVENDVKQGYAKRMTIHFPDRIEQRTLIVHKGKAYIHHCATPNVDNAWANVGSECVARGTTFHVAPPKKK